MEQNYILVNNGTVTDVIVWDGVTTYTPQCDGIALQGTHQIGDIVSHKTASVFPFGLPLLSIT